MIYKTDSKQCLSKEIYGEMFILLSKNIEQKKS